MERTNIQVNKTDSLEYYKSQVMPETQTIINYNTDTQDMVFKSGIGKVT